MDSEDEEWLKAFNKKKVRFTHSVHCLSLSVLAGYIFLLV